MVKCIGWGCFITVLRNIFVLNSEGGPGCLVGVATGYGLDGPGIESRWGLDFSAPVQTGPWTHPASCTMGTGSFLGVKRPGRGVDHLPHLVPRLKKGHSLTPRRICAFMVCSRVNFNCTCSERQYLHLWRRETDRSTFCLTFVQNTDQYGSVPIRTDQYGSVQISTDQYRLVHISTDQ